MAFAGTTAIRLLADAGFSGAGPRIWDYVSTDQSTAVGNITGYFGGQGFGSQGEPASGGPVGMKVGDLVFVRETTGGTAPGRVTMHSVISSTLNAAGTYVSTYGYDVTLSNSSTA